MLDGSQISTDNLMQHRTGPAHHLFLHKELYTRWMFTTLRQLTSHHSQPNIIHLLQLSQLPQIFLLLSFHRLLLNLRFGKEGL